MLKTMPDGHIALSLQSRAPEGGGVAAPAQGVGEHRWVSE